MRPLRLVMEAFGPFCVREEIDFRKLGDRGLFLIEGDTGSGKTTIFDGICAALYGQTSGGREQGHMKCLSAEADAICRLELEFQVGERSFRIERLPEQDRPARRGGGTTTQTHAATLWETTRGSERVLAAKLGQVAERMVEILGLSAEQFCQVVLLPQGRFENMLKARATERESVMRVLFQTDRYQTIQKRLEAAAKRAEEEVSEALRERDDILVNAGCATPEGLAQQQAAIRVDKDRVQGVRDELAQQESAARVECEAAREVVRKLAEQGEAERALAQMKARAPEVNGWRLEIDRADHASHVAPTDAALTEFRQQSREADEDWQRKKLLLDGARLQRSQAERAFHEEEKRKPEHDSLRVEIGRLEALEKTVVDLAGLRQQFEWAQEASTKAHQAQLGAQKGATEWAARLVAAEKHQLEQGHMAATLGERQKALQATEQAEDRRKQADKLRSELRRWEGEAEVAKEKCSTAHTRLVQARREFSQAQAAWVQAQAGVLAQTLAAGAPCPVCGSREHPVPATLGQASIDQDTLQAKERAVQEAQRGLDSAQDDLHKLEQKLAEAAGQLKALSEGADFPKQTGELEELRRRLTQSEAAAEAGPRLEKEIDKLRAEKQRRELEFQKRTETASERAAQWATAKAKFEQREQDVPERHRAPAALDQALKAAKAKLKGLTEALAQAQEVVNAARENFAKKEEASVHAQQVVEGASQRVKDLTEKLEREIAAEGFASLDNYRAAKRTREQVTNLRHGVEKFEGNLQAAVERHERTLAAAAGLVAPDIARLEARVGECKALLQQADTKLGGLAAAMVALENSQKRLALVQEKLAGREGRSGMLRRLANVANGTEPRNPGFHRFVLAERLDEVLLAANRRLGPMSGERYRLQRVHTEESLRVAAGLNLEVLDGYSGRTRPVDTLSGGESFLAALSLALGLADVVQQHAGGVKLDTVFVDEGFGSLDPNALELAMRCLEDLRQSGRLVGVISHVVEMKERIRDAQLRVTNRQGVSHTEFVVR